jgi:hypothetical protein
VNEITYLKRLHEFSSSVPANESPTKILDAKLDLSTMSSEMEMNREFLSQMYVDYYNLMSRALNHVRITWCAYTLNNSWGICDT